MEVCYTCTRTQLAEKEGSTATCQGEATQLCGGAAADGDTPQRLYLLKKEKFREAEP